MVSKCDTFHPHFVLFSFDLVRTLRFVQEEVRKAGMGRVRDIHISYYIYIPVVPARGGAEVALKIYNIDPGEPAAEVSEK
jgi:hypothetical protein